MRRFLHFITQPYSISIIEPLFRTIERQGAGEQKIFAAEKVKPFLDSKLPLVGTIEEAVKFNPEVVFIPGNVVHDKIPGLKVQIFHGLCEEKGGHYKITGFFDLYCTSGPLITKRFIALAQKKKHFLVSQTGWPKVDNLLRPYQREELCQRLKLDPTRKIILYAPTFSPRFKSSNLLINHLPDLPREDETWVIKFHDLMNPAEVRAFLKLDKNYFRFYSHPDIIPLLQVADVLISDTSSVVYEFMLLDKPVITIRARVRQEKGINIEDGCELRAAVDRSLQNPDEFAENRRKVMEQIHPYRDTENSLRVIKVVDEVLKEGLHLQLKRKPLNLYRKWQVRKRWGHWW